MVKQKQPPPQTQSESDDQKENINQSDGNALENAQKEAAEERENERGYQ